MALDIVILAAGKGTRMKSALPKVLHRLAGRALLLHVLDTCAALHAQRTVIVTGYAADAVVPILGKSARRFADAAADLQTILGEHNDAVVAGSWLRTWAAVRRSGDAAFAAGMLAGIERAAANDARERWRKAWKHLVAAREAM